MWKKRLANYLLKHLYNTVTEDDILVYRNGRMYLQGLELTENQVAGAINEATLIKGYKTWDLLIKAMQWEANKQMYQTAKTTDDMLFGKAILYTVDVLQKKIENLSNLK